MSSSPISRVTAPYCNGLVTSWASNTTLGVSAGSCSDSNNVFDITLRSAIVINTAVKGANGLDTGTLAASTVYYVHLIGDYMNSNPTAAVVSLSATSPLLPVGYEVSRRIGWAVTDGSTHFILMYQSGSGLNRLYSFDAPLTIASAGVETSFTAIALTTFVPAINNVVLNVQMAFTPAAASNTAHLRSGGSAATTGLVMVGQVAAVIAEQQMQVVSKLVTGVPTIEYKVSAGALTVASLVSVTDAL